MHLAEEDADLPQSQAVPLLRQVQHLRHGVLRDAQPSLEGRGADSGELIGERDAEVVDGERPRELRQDAVLVEPGLLGAAEERPVDLAKPRLDVRQYAVLDGALRKRRVELATEHLEMLLPDGLQEVVADLELWVVGLVRSAVVERERAAFLWLEAHRTRPAQPRSGTVDQPLVVARGVVAARDKREVVGV